MELRSLKAAAIAILAILMSTSAGSAQISGGPHFSAGMVGGYNGGTGLGFYGRVDKFARDLPLSVKLGFGYTSVEPGNATEARRIFINNATNGIPEKRGRILDLRMDFMYRVKFASFKRAYLLAGPRYSRFLGNFKYVGGNEDFDVKSNQWGIGLGAESYFAISRLVDFVVSAGYEYFPPTRLSGHDTAYSPDDDNINAREDFTFNDADEAIKQPRHKLLFMLGLSYTFGLK